MSEQPQGEVKILDVLEKLRVLLKVKNIRKNRTALKKYQDNISISIVFKNL